MAAAPPAPGPRLMMPRLDALVAAVQTNCHIADARHAADLTLCTYLLQMREFYRWERGLPLGASLPRDAVGAWLAQREARWAELEDQPFVSLPVHAPAANVSYRRARFDPFDVAGLNRALLPHGWVYGAGLAGRDRPGFFLAQLEQLATRESAIVVQVCGREHARGLFAPPASLQGDIIVLRRESLARWLWEKFEAFSQKRARGPFKAVVDAYGLDRDFHAALPRMLDEQGETLILHEIGEHRAGQGLGSDWGAMRLLLPSRRCELHVRAVRDHLADLRVTLPTLLERQDATAIHFWFSTFDGIRAALFPSLTLAYEAWTAGDGGVALQRAARQGTGHFEALAEHVLTLFRQQGDQSGPAIERLLTAPDAVCRA